MVGKIFFQELFEQLSKERVRYVVVGGVAMVLYGAVRFTADLDLLVDLEKKNVRKFIHCLNKLGYKPKVPVKIEEFALEKARKKWIEEKGMKIFSFFHPEIHNRLLDVFTYLPINYEEVDKEKSMISAGEVTIPVISISHLKKLKNISGRLQDLADIEALEKLERMNG